MRALLLACCSAAALAAEPAIQPASNTDPDGEVGKRPYEMAWAKRTPAHPELVDFEDLDGWTAASFRGCKARLVRSREEQMFGDYTGRVTYTGETAASSFELRPPKPIPILGETEAVQLWVRGNNWGWHPKPKTARTQITVVVRDAKGKQVGIPLGQVNFDDWFLMHRLFGPQDYPLTFVAIRVSGCSDPRPARLSFDSLQFYKPDLKPLADAKLPPRDVPWPTTPDTITPTPKGKVLTQSRGDDAHFVFEAKGTGDAIRWVYAPQKGTLDDLTVEINGKRFQPCAGGGPVLFVGGQEVDLEDEAVTRKVTAVDRSLCIVVWNAVVGGESVSYSYQFRAKDKSLQITCSATEPKATAFRIGRTRGTPDADLFRVPYLTLGNGPHLLHWDGVFLSALLDWYNSDASTLFVEHGNPAPGEYILNGGSRYLPLTSGVRNPLRERLIVTVSTNVQEVLPHIPHPKSDTAHLARSAVWRNIGEPNETLLKRLKARGVENFICPLHEVGWRDAGESFTFRLRCAPRIGDEKMKQYGEWVKNLGYRFGLYANYTDFAPVNGHWSPDRVCLQPDGNWTRAWPRCYAPKPTYAWRAEAELAPQIAEKFGANTCYSDVHTSVFPWQRTDYDARVQGAGMFRATWSCYARVLWNESKAYKGPVFSEGACQWLYAGISDGNYGQMGRAGAPRWRRPPLVDFDLLKMHPLMCDFGMGMPGMFYDRYDSSWRKPATPENPYLDRFITSTLAFGHIGYLPLDWGFEGAIKCYYMTNAVQQHYALVPAEEIRYFDGEKLLDTSAAIRTGAYKRGQVYVKYTSGLQLWCNLSFEHDWAVERYVIPPGGHLVAHPAERFVQYSARFEGGKHVDAVTSKQYHYTNNRGEWDSRGVATMRGSLAVFPQTDGSIRLIPSEPHEPVSIRVRGQAWTCEARDVDGKPLGAATTRIGNLGTTVMPVKGAISYTLVPGGRIRTPDPDGELRPLVVGLDHTIEGFTRDFVGSDLSIESVQIERVLDDGSAVDKRTIEGTVKPVRVRVPADVALGELLWWRCQVKGTVDGKAAERTLWFAGVAVQGIDATVTVASSTPQKPGSAQHLTVAVKSNLPEPADVTVAAAAKGLKLTPDTQTVRLTPLEEETLTLEYLLPSEPALFPVALTFTSPHGHQVARYQLRVRSAQPLVTDLAGLKPTNTGMAFRGKAERPLDTASTGAQFFPSRRAVGGMERQGFFCHPPYKGGVGYAFGEFRLTLPGAPCIFETWVGFADGSSTSDGCVFSVQVEAGGKWETVASVQHAEVKAWKALRADLAKYKGQQFRVRLVTDVGPKDDSNSDWACWGDPRIVRAGTYLVPSVTAD